MTNIYQLTIDPHAGSNISEVAKEVWLLTEKLGMSHTDVFFVFNGQKYRVSLELIPIGGAA